MKKMPKISSSAFIKVRIIWILIFVGIYYILFSKYVVFAQLPDNPPTASISGSANYCMGTSASYSSTGVDAEGLSRLQIVYSPTSSENWTSLLDDSSANGNFYISSFNGVINFPSIGNYYIANNAYDTGGNKCSGSPFGVLPGWYDCGPNDFVTVNVKDCVPPDKASVSGANICAGSYVLSWFASDPSPSSGIKKYLFRLDDKTNGWASDDCSVTPLSGDVCDDNVSTNSYTYTNFQAGHTYDVWVAAVDNSDNVGPFSDKALIRVTSNPGVPTNFNASTGLFDKIDLTWSSGSDATGYEIFRDGTSGSDKIAAVGGTSYTDTGVVCDGTLHTYYLRSINSCAVSSFITKQGSCVLNQAPTCSLSVDKSPPYSILQDLKITASVSDPNLGDTISSYSWSASAGSLRNMSQTTTDYTTTSLCPTSSNINYTVYDSQGAQGSCNVSIDVACPPPFLDIYNVSSSTIVKDAAQPTTTKTLSFKYDLFGVSSGTLSILSNNNIAGNPNICTRAGVNCSLSTTIMEETFNQTETLTITIPNNLRGRVYSYGIRGNAGSGGNAITDSENNIITVSNLPPTCSINPSSGTYPPNTSPAVTLNITYNDPEDGNSPNTYSWNASAGSLSNIARLSSDFNTPGPFTTSTITYTGFDRDGGSFSCQSNISTAAGLAHNICNASYACVVVAGSGSDECDVSNPCVAPKPPTPNVSQTVSCLNAGLSSGNYLDISWAPTSPDVTRAEISSTSSFTTAFSKDVTGATITNATTGFKNGSVDLMIEPNKNYYVRLWNGLVYSDNSTFSFSQCTGAGADLTHSGCYLNTCVSISGSGPNYCSVDLDCIPNNAPTNCSITPSSGTYAKNRNVTLTADAFDPDGDNLLYTWNLPSCGTYSSPTTSKTINYTTPNVGGQACNVPVTIDDQRGGTASCFAVISTRSDTPPAPTITKSVSCIPDGLSSGDYINISWPLGISPPPTWVDISTDSFISYAHKDVTGVNSTVGPSGFNWFLPNIFAGQALSIEPNKTYYVRLNNGVNGSTSTFSFASCGGGQTHLGCYLQACQAFSGAGSNLCNSNLECQSNQSPTCTISGISSGTKYNRNQLIPDIRINGIDPNGDPLSYSWNTSGCGSVSGSNSQTTNYTTSSAGGTCTIRGTVTDPLGYSGTCSATVWTNSPPILGTISIADTTPLTPAYGDDSYDILVNGISDPDGDSLTYQWIHNTPGWFVLPTSGNISSSGRVANGLQVLYTFEEGVGSTVSDISGTGSPFNLTIQDPSAVSWIPGGGISVNSNTKIWNSSSATKIINAAKLTNEITVEAWVKPKNTTQSGVFIAGLTRTDANRNFSLAQVGDTYYQRLRTTATPNDASPGISSPSGSVNTNLTHLVYTRDTAGNHHIYVNGSSVVSGTLVGDFSGWANNHNFVIANQRTDNRPWLGEIYLVAVYNRALTNLEVDQNYDAGSNSTASLSNTLFPNAPLDTVGSWDVTLKVTDDRGDEGSITGTFNTEAATFKMLTEVRFENTGTPLPSGDTTFCTDDGKFNSYAPVNDAIQKVKIQLVPDIGLPTPWYETTSAANGHIISADIGERLKPSFYTMYVTHENFPLGYEVICIYDMDVPLPDPPTNVVANSNSLSPVNGARNTTRNLRILMGVKGLKGWFQTVGSSLYTKDATDFNLPPDDSFVTDQYEEPDFNILNDRTTYSLGLSVDALGNGPLVYNNFTSVNHSAEDIPKPFPNFSSGTEGPSVKLCSGCVPNKLSEYSTMIQVPSDSNLSHGVYSDADDLEGIEAQPGNLYKIASSSSGPVLLDVAPSGYDVANPLEFVNFDGSAPEDGMVIVYVDDDLEIVDDVIKPDFNTTGVLFVVTGDLIINKEVTFINSSFIVLGKVTILEETGVEEGRDKPLVIRGLMLVRGDIMSKRHAGSLNGGEDTLRYENRGPIEYYIFDPRVFFGNRNERFDSIMIYLQSTD